jgi:hypothetical protein
MIYRYTVVPFQGQQSVVAAAKQLEELINGQAQQGWEFVRVETIDTSVSPGCLAALLGGRAAVVSFNMVVFRRAG